MFRVVQDCFGFTVYSGGIMHLQPLQPTHAKYCKTRQRTRKSAEALSGFFVPRLATRCNGVGEIPALRSPLDAVCPCLMTDSQWSNLI